MNVPIACANVLVMPGDIIIADDDGAVVVPIALAPELAKKAGEKHEWEDSTPAAAVRGGRAAQVRP